MVVKTVTDGRRWWGGGQIQDKTWVRRRNRKQHMFYRLTLYDICVLIIKMF